MKKIVIENIDDVEKLYQKFKKRIIKDFRDGKNPDVGGQEMIQWLMKKTGLNEITANEYLVQFAEVLIQDVDIKEWK